MPETSVQVIEEKASGMMAQVAAVKVTNAEELAAVSDMTANVKKLAKWITAERDKFTAPAKEIIATAKQKYDPYIQQCREAEITLKVKAQSFMLAKQERAEKEKAKIVKKVESGYMKPETAMDKLANVEEAPTATKTDSSTLRMTMRPDMKIVDETLIPDEYYKPRELDLVKLRHAVISGIEVPGTKRIETPVMASR